MTKGIFRFPFTRQGQRANLSNPKENRVHGGVFPWELKDRLSVPARSSMNAETLERILRETFVAQVEYYPVLGSTNDRAREVALSLGSCFENPSHPSKDVLLPLPWLVLADRQTAGRGRGKNRWWTGSGSLAMSLLLPPLAYWKAGLQGFWTGGAGQGASWQDSGPDGGPISPGTVPPGQGLASSPPEKQTLGRRSPSFGSLSASCSAKESTPGLIGLGAALAVVETVRPRLPEGCVGLHWPNDVFAAGKKLAGILVEILGCGLVVVGIGVNTNNTVQDAPEGLKVRVTTLKDLTGRTHSPSDFLIELLQSLQRRFQTLGRFPHKLADEAHQGCLQKGKTLRVQTAGGLVEGLCEGIGPGGELLLNTSSGLCRIWSGSIVE